MPDRAAGRPEQRGPAVVRRERKRETDQEREEDGERGEAGNEKEMPGTPPPWDLPSFTAAEIWGPTLLIYRYLDTYTLTDVVF